VPSQRVNDYAGLLPADARGRLESTLAQRESATGAQMVIAIFPSLEGESLDNGVILLVFVKERRVRMEVGYGLEPVLTDAVASQIVRETIAPRFREQRYAAGLQGAVDAVFARVDTKALSPARRSPGRGVSPWTLAVLGVFGVVVVMLAIDAMSGGRARRNAYVAGGRRGWDSPTVIVPPIWGMGGGGGRGGGGESDSGFSAGGGSFGGGGASGDW